MGRGQGSARSRLRAFVEAYLAYALDHLDLPHLSETADRLAGRPLPDRRVPLLVPAHRDPARSGAAAGDPDALLTPLAADHLRAVVAELGAERVRAAVVDLVDSVTMDE